MLINHLLSADKGWSSSLGVRRRATNLLPQNKFYITKLTIKSQIGGSFYGTIHAKIWGLGFETQEGNTRRFLEKKRPLQIPRKGITDNINTDLRETC
jgi:hypothetical protein